MMAIDLTNIVKVNEVIYLRCTLAKRCACHRLMKISSTTKDLLEITNTQIQSRFEYKSDSIILTNKI